MPFFAAATSPGRCVESVVSMNATSFSSSSLKRVAARRPTIASATVAWCRCVRMYLTGARSAGAAASLSRFSRAWLSEWSISVLTHERGPRSKSVAGFAAMSCSRSFSSLASRVSRLQLEARYRALELLGHRRQVANRARGLLRAARGLPRDLEDVLHVLRDLVGGVGLRLRGLGDLLDQLGQGFRHEVDLRQSLARRIRQLRALDHAGGRLLHGRHRVLRVRLNGLDDRTDLLRAFTRALSDPLNLFGNNRQAASRA